MIICKIKNKFHIILDYMLAILIVFSCGSIYDNLTNSNLYISELFIAILFIRVIVLVFKNRDNYKKSNIRKLLIFTILYLIYQSVYIFLNCCNPNIVVYIAKLVVIFLLFILYYFFSNNNEQFKKILDYISNIVFIISAISIFFYLFGSVLNWINNTGAIEVTFGFTRSIKSYCMIYFEPQYTIVFNEYIIRNCGIFAEAPMYTIVLITTLAYELFIKKSMKTYKIILLILTILTTLSTIGIVLSAMLLIIRLIDNIITKSKIFSNKKMIVISILIVICSLIIGIISVMDKVKSPSFRIRMDDYVASYKAWKDKPLFGNRLSKL